MRSAKPAAKAPVKAAKPTAKPAGKAAAKAAPGISFARIVRCKAIAFREHMNVGDVAKQLYGERDPSVVEGELNGFLSGHRVLSVERRSVDQGENSF